MSGSIKWALILSGISVAGNLLVIFAPDGGKPFFARLKEHWGELASGVFFFAILGDVVGFDGAAR